MANPTRVKCWYEMKDTRGRKSFRVSEWKQEQRDFAHALRYSKKGILVRTEGTTGLPDYKYAYQEPTFIVINYPDGFVVIYYEVLLLEIERNPKPITWKRALEISTSEVLYKK